MSEQKPLPAGFSMHRALHHLMHGGLHKALNVKQGAPIPDTKLAKARESDNPHVAAMAHIATLAKEQASKEQK